MNLEQELNKLNIQITFSPRFDNKEYYIIINKDNIETKYVTYINDINELCSYIGILLLNKVPSSIIENKLNVFKTKDSIYSTIKPLLKYPKKTYLVSKYNYFPRDRGELYHLVYKLIKIRGNNCSLNDIDVSKVTSMNSLFEVSMFNGDISKWDTSNVVDMIGMFEDSMFKGDISKWNISSLKFTQFMFLNSPLEDKEPKWYKDYIRNVNR